LRLTLVGEDDDDVIFGFFSRFVGAVLWVVGYDANRLFLSNGIVKR